MAREKLTPAQKAEIAYQRFAPLREGKPPLEYDKLKAVAEVREQVPNIAELSLGTIQKAVSDAFQAGYVRITKDRIVPPYRRNSSIERGLRDLYRDLGGAIVIEPRQESEDETSSQGPASDGSVKPSKNEFLLMQAADALADHIGQSMFAFEPGDHVGLSSGRAVYNLIASLRDGFPKFRVSDISIISLTGSMFAQKTAKTLDLLLDADTNCALLSQLFEGEVRTRPVALPLAHEPELHAQLLSRLRFTETALTKAIVGMGVLAPGHRLYDATVRGEAISDIAAIQADLNKLVEHVHTLTRLDPTFFPVFDVCNFLFWVPPSPDSSGELANAWRDVESGVDDLVNRINQRTAAITIRELEATRNVMMIAPSRMKGRGVFHLLTHHPKLVNILVTDRGAADVISDSGRRG